MFPKKQVCLYLIFKLLKKTVLLFSGNKKLIKEDKHIYRPALFKAWNPLKPSSSFQLCSKWEAILGKLKISCPGSLSKWQFQHLNPDLALKHMHFPPRYTPFPKLCYLLHPMQGIISDLDLFCSLRTQSRLVPKARIHFFFFFFFLMSVALKPSDCLQ